MGEAETLDFPRYFFWWCNHYFIMGVLHVVMFGFIQGRTLCVRPILFAFILFFVIMVLVL